MFTVVPESVGDEDRTGSVALGESSSVIDDIVREGARRLLAEALAAEVEVCIAGLAEECDEAGRRLVVRNGYPHRESFRLLHRNLHQRSWHTVVGVPAGVPQLAELVFSEQADQRRHDVPAGPWQVAQQAAVDQGFEHVLR